MVQPAAVALPGPGTQPGQIPAVPFRRGTLERTEILPSDTGTITTGTQRIERTIEGSGFVYGINLQVVVTTAGNAAAVAYTEDAPWAALDSVIFRDVNGELLNLTGYDLYLANLVNRQYSGRYPDATTVTADTGLFNLVAGAVATGGSFTFWLRVPVGINRRDLIGILGNQDRAQKYSLRNDIGASGAIYTVAPTAAGAFSVNKFYENYAVPMPVTPQGQPQEILPGHFGTLHFLTSSIADAAPIGGGTIGHYLRRIGNTVRYIVLVFRSNGSRATAAANAPTNIRLKVGEDTIFNESFDYRQFLMFERYGFDFPNGVLVYDALHDFGPGAGFELGDDYYHTQAIVNAQFQITYPAGFGATNNSLRIITDDLARVGGPVR